MSGILSSCRWRCENIVRGLEPRDLWLRGDFLRLSLSICSDLTTRLSISRVRELDGKGEVHILTSIWCLPDPYPTPGLPLSMPTANGDSSSHNGELDLSDFHIAVVGGGIGGLSAALAIARYCPTLTERNITVYEQAPEYKEIGAGVSIGVSAGRVLQKLGVYDAVNAISGYCTNVHRSNHRWDTDELIVDASAFNSGGANEDVRQLWLHRAEFLEVLYSEVRRRKCARLETNKKCVGLEVCFSSLPLLEICSLNASHSTSDALTG